MISFTVFQLEELFSFECGTAFLLSYQVIKGGDFVLFEIFREKFLKSIPHMLNYASFVFLRSYCLKGF